LRKRLTGRSPRRLTYAEADRAISTLATKLRGLGLQTDAVVAIHLANTVTASSRCSACCAPE
jgi:non-ribosomal peptide synthetase component E (peptide arylation enzyme)